MIEDYRKLREYPMYRIYNTGKIYSEYYKKFIHQHDDNSGYLQVTLRGIHGRKTVKTHILVAKAFIPNPYNLPEVNHKDCNKYNNKVTNLEWINKHDNMKYASIYSYKHREELSPLTQDHVRLIPILLKYGFSIKLIASLYKVGHVTIRNIIQKKTWKHLNLDFPKVKFNRGIIEVGSLLYNKIISLNVDNTVLNSRVKVLESV